MTDDPTTSSVDANKNRVWQRMLSGRRLDLLDPSADDIEIEDIAHGLARVARWNGQTVGEHAFSVAQHSILVERIVVGLDPAASPTVRLAALLHDAAEYVIGDLISPFKNTIGTPYRRVEARIQEAIYSRFGINQDEIGHNSDTIKRADRVCALFEARFLAGFDSEEAERFFGKPATLPTGLEDELSRINPLSAPNAQDLFLKKYKFLRDLASKD